MNMSCQYHKKSVIYGAATGTKRAAKHSPDSELVAGQTGARADQTQTPRFARYETRYEYFRCCTRAPKFSGMRPAGGSGAHVAPRGAGPDD
jgi:hypothetical protein